MNPLLQIVDRPFHVKSIYYFKNFISKFLLGKSQRKMHEEIILLILSYQEIVPVLFVHDKRC